MIRATSDASETFETILYHHETPYCLGDTNISNQNAEVWAAQNMSEDEILDANDGKHMKSSFVKETLELYLK